MFDPVTAVIQAGVEKRVNRIALSFDYGLRFNRLFFHDLKSDRKEYRYSKSKAEIKYFVRVRTRNIQLRYNPYMSLQGLYLPQHYRKDNSWLDKGDKSYLYNYSYIDRKVAALTFIMGEELIRNKFVYDLYFGWGIRRMTIAHHPFNAVERIRSRPIDWGWFTPADYREGVFYRPHLAVGIKIGYIPGKLPG